MEPYHFFKYRKIDKLFLNSLEEGIIYCAQPERLNDPFDCRVNIRNALANALKLSGDEESKKLRRLIDKDDLFDTLQNDLDNMGICSFSLSLMHLAMWTHYADNHRGVCVLYEFPHDFLVDPGNEIIGVSNVCYEKDSVTQWFAGIIKKLPVDFDEFVIELAKTLLTAKSPYWKYEKEVRIIRKSSGPFKIPKSYIKQICFGLQTSEEDMSLIQKITNNFESNVNYCRVMKDDSDFGIVVLDM